MSNPNNIVRHLENIERCKLNDYNCSYCRFWIGLQKSATGHYWNLGDSCQMAPASYQNLNSASDTGVNLVYSYLKNQTWNGATTNSLANSAICRWGRNKHFVVHLW